LIPTSERIGPQALNPRVTAAMTQAVGTRLMRRRWKQVGIDAAGRMAVGNEKVGSGSHLRNESGLNFFGCRTQLMA
jgi:hypothetical protein